LRPALAPGVPAPRAQRGARLAPRMAVLHPAARATPPCRRAPRAGERRGWRGKAGRRA